MEGHRLRASKNFPKEDSMWPEVITLMAYSMGFKRAVNCIRRHYQVNYYDILCGLQLEAGKGDGQFMVITGSLETPGGKKGGS